ncbi:MAG: hypothetical protein AAGA99_07680 [Actinomycetota bacterium]
MSDRVLRRHAVRVWLPDRPGGLGAIASRVGAVGAEIVGIEIVDREGGQAVDDLLVQLPPGVTTDLLVREIGEVDGARVEDVRDLEDAPPDARLQALETACSLAEAPAELVIEELTAHAHRDNGADWTVTIDLDDGTVLAERGDHPGAGWVHAYAVGSLAGADGERTGSGSTEDDAVCVPIGADGGRRQALTLGRTGRGFRRREHEALRLMASLAAARLASCESASDRTH